MCVWRPQKDTAATRVGSINSLRIHTAPSRRARETEARPAREAALHDEHRRQRPREPREPRREPPRRVGAALLREHAVQHDALDAAAEVALDELLSSRYVGGGGQT